MSELPAERRRELLVELLREARGCCRCPLHEGRTKVVFGMGNADASLMFVGEAPGFHEDQQGLPFVGRAGQLLEELLRGIGLERREVFIANVLKCRPPGNRDPLPAEIEACKPFLLRQIELVDPRVIATLGNFATKLLTRSQRGIGAVHGTPQVHEIAGRRRWVMPLYHPAAALRTPRLVDELRLDFRALAELLRAPLPAPVRSDAFAVADGSSGAGSSAESEPQATAAADGALQLGLFG
ncbi:uracil-DNA glycosylase [Thermoleophilum album]|uniref:Type-4 uracil-DNA glycosylase n=1 Tax=Thermoleophilum album TaxID=29539 RepID=A0A1H6FTA1_THEAL|nr:uracil-DNA glycosylase [Thermoleophilum album]SEH14049.1 DNA polymerase [Thermoleophilum album]